MSSLRGRPQRGSLLSCVAALVLVACGADEHPLPPPPIPDLGERDAGRRDGEVPDGDAPDGDVVDDGGALEDGEVPDSGDGGEAPDAFTFDAAGLDFGVIPAFDLGPDGFEPVETPDLGPPEDLGITTATDLGMSCPATCGVDADCGTGYVCLPGGCSAGARHCERAGVFCSATFACNPGETCTVLGGVAACAPIAAGVECVTSLSCTPGFSCELDTVGVAHCVDRRKTCFFGSGGCPMGFSCVLGVASLEPFCRRTLHACTVSTGCPPGGWNRCADLEGDGDLECAPVVDVCTTNAECTSPTAPTCVLVYPGGATGCGVDGLCRTSADCSAGYGCVDVHGDGYTQCHPTAGCQRDSTCPPRALCVDDGTGSAACLDG